MKGGSVPHIKALKSGNLTDYVKKPIRKSMISKIEVKQSNTLFKPCTPIRRGMV
jgi:hypothetical protein